MPTLAVPRRALAAAICAALLLACGGGANDEAGPEGTAAGATEQPATAAATEPATAAGTPLPDDVLDRAVDEVTAAAVLAGAVRAALAEASSGGSWTPVADVCAAYPLAAPEPGSELPITKGLHTRSRQPELWPQRYRDLDATTATACFLAGAAQSIPPDARIEDGAPTTAEIIAQSVVLALDLVGEPTPQELRLLIDEQRAGG